ncbi:MAG: hypothetical protein ACKPBV_21300 [Sphaerospermopsis kisseleviana]
MDPNPYLSPSATGGTPPSSRPASLIVFGILNTLFGVLGLCGTAGSATMFLVDLPSDPAVPNPALELLKSDATYRLFMQVALVLGGLMALMLIVAGIGLLLTKGWGRTLSIGYAWYAILAGILGMIVNWMYLIQPAMAAMKDAQGPAAMGALVGLIGGLLGGLFSLIYPIVLLIFMNRAVLRQAVNPRVHA